MTFLPIVERELRVATRKRFTYWLRVVAAGVALIIGGGYFLLMTVVPFAGASFTVGGPLFAILSWLCFAAALSAGVFFTSDCLSEEKREGTLGFLFLTNLRGYDVVLGKLAATSLRCVFALLAVFPILAVTLLLGGVAPGPFWMTMLALLNALFCSLATGMFVSAISRNGQKALVGTIALLGLWTFCVPIFDILAPRRAGLDFSPSYVFRVASGGGSGFWWVLMLCQAVAWAQLALASFLIRRNWQVKDANPEDRTKKHRPWWRSAGDKRRRALRERWLSRDPMLWLALREQGRFSLPLLWLALFAAVGLVVLFKVAGGEIWVIWNFLSGVVSLVVYLAVASQAAQFFAEARRTRLVELLLAAPLSAREVIMGPWRALVRSLGGLVVLLIGVEIGGKLILLITESGFGYAQHPGLALATALIGAIVLVANLTAVAWFGLWMGMTSRNALVATLKTIVFVQIVPWFMIMIASGLLVPIVLLPTLMKSGAASTSAAWFSAWYPFLSMGLTACLALGKDYFFWRWSRRKLMQDFREQAARVVAPVVVHFALASPPAPPVIRTT